MKSTDRDYRTFRRSCRTRHIGCRRSSRQTPSLRGNKGMKARANSCSRDPNRWHGQRALWKRLWESRDAQRRHRRPPENEQRDEQDEPPRKFYVKCQVRKPPSPVQVNSVNRARNVGHHRLCVLVGNIVAHLDFRLAVRTTVVHFLRYKCVVVLRH